MQVVLLLIAGFALSSGIYALWRALTDHRTFKIKLAQLDHQIHIAKQMIDRRGQLANELAHEVKNPLSAILCSADTLDLLVGSSLPESQQQCLRYIREYGNEILRMVSDFLDFSRLDAGLENVHTEATDVNTVVHSVTGILLSNAQKKKIVIENELEIEPTRAFANARALRRVIFNLLHNAVKFTPEGGKVRVAVRPAQDKKSIAIVIEDSGPGFSATQHSNGARPGSQGEQGLGLGLSICRSLISQMSGTISFGCSEFGGGKVEILLVSAPHIEDETKENDKEQTPLQGQKFLVIDSDPAVNDSLARLLEAWGGMVEQVHEATSALQTLTVKNFDAVMIDPDQLGIQSEELSQSLDYQRAQNQAKVILAQREKGASDFAIQADCLIQKPLNSAQILKALRSH